MTKETIYAEIKKFMLAKRMRHDENMIAAWVDMVSDRANKYKYTDSSITRAIDRCLDIQYPDIGDLLSCMYGEKDRPTLDEMQQRHVCSQFCSWCREVKKHDLLFGDFFCAVCGDKYIKDRSDKVRQECRERQIGPRVIKPADIEKLNAKLQNAVRKEI